MYIYFCGSIRGGRQDVNIYQKIVKKLQTYGQVLSHDDVSEKGEDAVPGGDEAIYDRDMVWLTQSDVVVAEITQPSFGVGYEIGQAMAMKKKTLCLFRPSSGRVISAMIQRAEGKLGRLAFQVRDYEEEEVEGILENYFSEDAVSGGDEAIYERDIEWLTQSDVVVAEVTQPSLGVGCEIGQAVAMRKKTLCLFRPSSGKVLSAMIRGAESKLGSSVFQVQDYEEEEVEGILEKYFGELTKD